MRANAWPGPATFEPPELPDFMWESTSLWPTPATVFEEVGPEVLLLVIDPAAEAGNVVAFEPFQMEIAVGSLETPEGALGYAVFAALNPAGGPPIAAWERYFDAGDDLHLAPYAGLADQSYWHVLILGAERRTLAAYEVANDGTLHEPLAHAVAMAGAAPLQDLNAAVAWAQGRYQLPELFNAAVQRARSERQMSAVLDRLRECVDTDDREGAREVGQGIHDSGGFEGMQWVHRTYTERFGDDGAPRVIDMWWGGIGAWLG